MEGSVEHDDGEGEDEAGVSLLEYVWVLLTVVGSKGVHDPVNLHGFTWQPGKIFPLLVLFVQFQFPTGLMTGPHETLNVSQCFGLLQTFIFPAFAP